MKKLLRHLFTPHESNNHRPRILHIKSFLITIALFLSLSSVLPFIRGNYPSVLGISFNISVSELLNLTNVKRQEIGVLPVILNDQLNLAAASKAKHMIENNYWAHISPDGTTPWVHIKNAGYNYLYAGENLARGFTTASEVVDAWMKSPTHKDNMLSKNYEEIGFAIQEGKLTGDETVLVVEMFGSRTNPIISPSPILEEPAVPVSPEPSISPAPPASPSIETQATFGSAEKPLVDSTKFSLNVSVMVIALFILILMADLVIIERKQIVRFVGHNIDHMLYLGSILILVILLSRSSIL